MVYDLGRPHRLERLNRVPFWQIAAWPEARSRWIRGSGTSSTRRGSVRGTMTVGRAPTPEVLVHAVAAVPNGLTVEHMPWAFPLFKAVPEVRNGEMIVPQSPGQGIEFSEERLAHSALS